MKLNLPAHSKFDSSWMLHLHQRVVHAKGKRGIGARAKQMASADGGEEVAKRTFPCSLCDFKGLSKVGGRIIHWKIGMVNDRKGRGGVDVNSIIACQ